MIRISLRSIQAIGSLQSKPWAIALVVLIFLGLSVMPVTAFDKGTNFDGQLEAVGPISTLAQDQFAPRLAYASQVDEYLAVWENVARSDDYDILARRVDNGGIPIGSEISIDVDAYMDTHPVVAYSPVMNEYLVVWENEFETDTADHDILAQRVAANGSMVGGVIYVAYTGNYDGKPVVTYNPGTHEYLVVFERRGGNPEFYHQDLVAQRVYEDGTLMGDEIVIANGLLDEQAPAVACDGANYLVVWQGDYSDETNIYDQRIGGDGSLIGGQIGISTWTLDQLKPQLTYNSNDGQYFVVWEDHHFSPWGIYGYRLDQAGSPVGSQVSVATSGEKNRSDPHVAYLPGIHSYMVVWQFEFSSGDQDISSRRVAYDGSLPDPEIVISQQYSQEQHPAVASDGWERRLVAWEDWRNYGVTGVDIYGSMETITVPVLSGHVYSGDVGILTDPIAGVTVQLGCSNNNGSFGNLIGQTITNAQGEYQIPAYVLCEYYNITETDLGGYFSVGAQFNGDGMIDSNWIYYQSPLTGKVHSGNNFWDKIQGPSDDTPPGNWANFQPASWVNIQTVEVSEQVEDTYSGLDVSTAEFNISVDGGASWSGWSSAEITGDPETTTPQVISATVPFGRDSKTQNQIQFRVADIAGNLGVGPVHTVRIDSVLPLNPTSISSSTHTPNVWSNNPYITIQWSGASDDRSGIDGYSTSFNQSPNTIPDIFRDTADPSLINYAYSDSSSWWFHVRTLDVAGNAASGAVHYGPFRIETVPPTAWITTPGGAVTQLTIFIEWDGDDNMSGVDYYEVQNNINGAGWNNWEVTPVPGAYYTGTRGQQVSFRVRARDNAGNIGEWSSPMLLSFGVDITVRVQNESWSYLQGAKVYRQGNYMGLTDATGTITVPGTMIGDTLAALYLVHVEPAVKSGHEWDGNISWAWRVYQTSIRIPNDGTPQLLQVTNTSDVQLLTVRKDQALIGVHIIAVVQWDANSAFFDDLRQGLISASSFLYDVTDGQFFYETIEIFDNEENGPSNDIIIYTDNTVWPNAFLSAITTPKGRMMFPPVFGPSWSDRVAYGTLIHEFGHYGLWLDDEYKVRTGDGGGFCTFNRATATEPTRASIMQDSDDASELCSRADPNHLHNSNTMQDVTNKGESTWETVMRVYLDKANPSRWTLQSPDTRSVAVVPGPNSLPIAEWVKVSIDNNDTQACSPYNITVAYPSGTPVIGSNVSVVSLPDSILYQGKTNNAGQITVRGAHNGDILSVQKGIDSVQSIINCTPTMQDEPSEILQQEIIIQPDPFTLEVNVVPLSNDTVQVQVDSSVVLAQAPQAQLLQEGATHSIAVVLTYDAGSGLYIGQATLDTMLELRGFTRVEAADTQENTVTRIVSFNILFVNPEGPTWLKSSDGRMEILLPEGSLTGNPVISIQPTSVANMQQDELVVIGNPYLVTTSTGEDTLQLPATLNIYYFLEQMHYVAIGLYQWDATSENWTLISTNVDSDNHFVSAQITQLGTYAILGKLTYQINIPWVTR